ncbi:MAG TPA: hypothetical protein VM598_10840 [Bdellovibrionota bacterium]|nr:hypothetical protein [Bdellovibrionota bacterium]
MRFKRLLCATLLVLTWGCSSAPRSRPGEDAPAPDPAAIPSVPETQIRQPKDGVFEIERADGCTIRWALHPDSKTDEISIEVRDSCRFGGKLSRSLPHYGELLDAVLARHSKRKLKRFYSASWKEIGSWDQDLAVAAMESGLWKTFTKKRKETKKELSPNRVFVSVFNEGRIHRKLAEVFEARGLTLTLMSVEKVFENRFKNLPFAHEYAAYSASSTKVPYSAAVFIFDIGLAP